MELTNLFIKARNTTKIFKLQEKPTARLFSFILAKVRVPASVLVRLFATASWHQPSTQASRARILSVSLRRERTKEEQGRVRQLQLRWKQGSLTAADKKLTKSLTGVFDYALQKRTTKLSKRETSRVRQILVSTIYDRNNTKFPGAGFANYGANNLLRKQLTMKVPFIQSDSTVLKPFRAAQHFAASSSGNVETVAEQAIVRKYFERCVQDLRLFTRVRCLPSHKITSFRNMRKLKRRRDNSLRASIFCIPDGSNYTAPKAGGWLSDNEAFLRIWTSGRRPQQAAVAVEPLYSSKSYTKSPLLIAETRTNSVVQPVETSTLCQTAELFFAALSPLHFNNHATTTCVAGTEKLQQRSKYDAYRLLMKYSDSITSIYPQLMHHLTHRTLTNKTVSYDSGVKVLKSCYWSLRLYSQFRSLWHQTAPVHNRAETRRSLLQTELAGEAKAQYSPAPFIKSGRFRFQKHKLSRLAPFRKVVLDWYHKFLPQYYTLLQEDAEKYQALELSLVKIQRAHPCPKAVIEWDTRAVGSLPEKKYERLTSSTVSWTAPRFENMLLTTHRSAAYPGAGNSLTARTVLSGRPPAVKQNFFRRAFSVQNTAYENTRDQKTNIIKQISAVKFKTTTTLLLNNWMKNPGLRFKFYSRAGAKKRTFSTHAGLTTHALTELPKKQGNNLHLDRIRSRSQHLVQVKPVVFLPESKKEDGQLTLQGTAHTLILAKSAYTHRHDNNLKQYSHLTRRRESRATFDARRQRAWRDLTSFWSKKFHVVRQWLKLNNTSLKSKSWAYAGKQRAVSDAQFKASRIRLRKLIWRESDEHFKTDKLRHAFSFHPKEYRANPWFEALVLRRALYNYQRLEYRRYQLPQDYRSNRWMQTCRKFLFKNKASHTYTRARSWPKLQRYSQRLQRSLFHWRSSKVGVKRTEKLIKQRPVATGLQTALRGCGDRLDVSLQQWHIAPTTFWARKMSEFGVVLVNGKAVFNGAHRLRTGDMITFMWGKIKKIQVLFTSPLKRYDKDRLLWNTTLTFPANIEYYAGIWTAKFLGLPARDDMHENDRVSERLVWHDMPDAGVGRY